MQHPGSSRLFPDSHQSVPSGIHIANIDGASRGNPGPASYAVILKDPAGKVIFQLGKKIGRQTNNVAEYYALLAALDFAANRGIHGIRVRSDSELLVRQMQGRYKVKSPELKPLYERASRLAREFQYFVIEHVPRESNRDADALANLALDGADAISSGGLGNRSEESNARAVRSSSEASARSPETRTIKARFVNGALVPSEPLDLPEGTNVLLTVRKPR